MPLRETGVLWRNGLHTAEGDCSCRLKPFLPVAGMQAS